MHLELFRHNSAPWIVTAKIGVMGLRHSNGLCGRLGHRACVSALRRRAKECTSNYQHYRHVLLLAQPPLVRFWQRLHF